MVKNCLFRYNIAFLLFGNILFSNIHYLVEHTHSDAEDECVECVYYENNSNYISSDNELSLFNNHFFTFKLNDQVFVKSKINKNFRSRAPPLS